VVFCIIHSVFIHICFVVSSCFFSMLLVFIYAYWCQTRFFSYQIMLVSFNSTTMRVTYGTGTANPSRSPEFIPDFRRIRVARSLVSCAMFYRLLFLFCPFSLGHCIICHSSIYDFSLPPLEWVSDCLTPIQQFFSYIMASQFSMRWWWGSLYTRPTRWVGFV
jgi:hypothetical protein